MEPETAGDPMSARKWRRSSLRHLSEQWGEKVSPTTGGRWLGELDYSLNVNVKRLTGKPHPDRDEQFVYLEQQKQAFLRAGLPVISVDTKKKELTRTCVTAVGAGVGDFKNPGRRGCHTADAVNEHAFRQAALGKAVPYGIYALAHKRGYLYVGQSADTPQFAVERIAAGWRAFGQPNFPTADKLLIRWEAGGSNGYRPRLGKQPVQELLADQLGLEVTLCHYPTGASKWNPIEHG